MAGRYLTLLGTLGLGLCLAAAPAPQQNPTAQAPPAPACDANAPADTASDQPAPEYTVLQERPDRLIAKLPNRMIVIAQEMPTAPVASAQVWVKTGSIYEQEHVGAGLSHFLEHLLSGGTTTTRSEAESNAILGRIGAQTNAATSLDTVRYYINTTSDHADTAIDLLSDWMRNSVIDEDQFLRERDVIQREFSMGEGDPGRIFWKLTQQARYTAHPARHPTIGYLDEFLSITREEIIDFYKRMYAPNNLVFVVAGDIDKQAVVEQIARLWSDAPTRELPELSFPVEPEISAPRSVTGKADIQQPRLRLAWPGTRLAGEGDYALDLLAMVLGQGETSRLVREVRDEKRLVNSIGSYNLSFPWGEGFFAVEAEVADFPVESAADLSPQELAQARLDRLTQAVLAAVEKVRDEPVSQAELDRAKRNVLADVLSANQTAEGVANRLASDVIGKGDPDYLPKYAQAIQQLTAEDLQQAAERFLTDSRLIKVQLLPRAKDEPAERLTRPADPIAGELPTEPVDIDNSIVLKEVREHVAAGDAEADVIEVDEPVMYTLDNGLRLIVQRSTLVPAVSMQMYWKGGLLGEPEDKAGIANAMAAMLTRGTTNYTAQELAAAIEDLGASLNAQSGSNTTFVQARALKEDWPRVFDLLAEVVKQPTFPTDEWARLQPRLLAAIDRQRDSWFGELSAEFREDYYQDHPWSNTPLGEKRAVANLDAEELAKFHAGQLVGPNTVIAVVGDVDPEQVRGQVERRFGDLPAVAQGEFVPQAPVPPYAHIEQTATRKPVAAVTIGFGPVVERSHPDYAVLQVLSRLLSNFPTGWLDQALRGEDGLVYADWAQFVTGLVPGHFGITFNTVPATVPEALARAMAVVERARQGDIPAEDLRRAKAKVLASEFFSRQSNADRAMQAALDELYGVSDPGGRQFANRVEALTAEDVAAAARKYLQNPVVTVLTSEPVDQQALEQAVHGQDEEADTVAADGQTAPAADAGDDDDLDPDAEPATATP